MKKLYILLCLLVAAFSAQATFVPNSSLLYNIIQTSSNLTLGVVGTQPLVQTANSRTSQAFQFLPVAGKTDTYYIQNQDGQYLNKKTTVDWDYWDVIYETAINGANSEWTITGEAASFRLMCGANSLYLASDAVTNGSPLYCDKAVDNVNGTFTVIEAVVIREVFEISDRNLGIEVEKDVQPYPVTITSTGVYENVYAKATTGFTLSKTTLTPEEFLANGGKLKIEVSTTAAPGTKGFVYFAVGTGDQETVFDTLWVTSVAKQKRYYIRNTSTDGLVIGNHSTLDVPALTDNLGATSQKFILRPVHPSVNDSLYYLIQDVTYRMIIKAFSSPWDVEFSNSCNESMWKLTPETNGTCYFTNFVTGKVLGTDGITADSRLYDDKSFTPAPTAKPFCEWKLIDTDSLSVFGVFRIAEKNQVIAIEKDFQSYPINITTTGVKETITATATTGYSLDKSSFTTEEVLLAAGKLKVRISSNAPLGTLGQVFFSRASSSIPFDTLTLTTVAVLPRYYIMNTSSNALVIGSDSTNTVPALTENKTEISQKFIVRPLHAAINDSLYYLVQDGEYRFLAKDKSNAWSTTFAAIASDESTWKIIPMPNGTVAIENFVTKLALGSDALTVNSWLWDDKTFTAAPTAAPFCEWMLVDMNGSAVKEVHGSDLNVIAKDGNVLVQGVQESQHIRVYNLYGQMIFDRKADSNTVSIKLNPGFYLIQVGTKTTKVIL